MALSALTLTLDRADYSRYEPGRDVVSATFKATGGTESEVVTVTLSRATALDDRILQTVAHALPASPNDEQTVTFDLTAIADAQGFNICRLSQRLYDYYVRVTAGAVIQTVKFTVLPVTAEGMKARWLAGLPLTLAEQLGVLRQPRTVTGVTVKEVAQTSDLGRHDLVFVKGSPSTLSWSGGTAETLVTTETEFILQDQNEGYTVVEVVHASLPAGNATEALLVQNAKLEDDMLRQEIIAAYVEVQRYLQVQLEPAHVVSDHYPDPEIPVGDDPPTTYDIIFDGASYYRPEQRTNWISIQLPFVAILHITSLAGYFNQTKVVEITREWQAKMRKGGMVQLVPSNAAVLNWQFFAPGLQAYFTVQTTLPKFWAFNMTIGLRALDETLRAFIGARAAIKILTVAGNARYEGGLTSLSVSRDGVSENRSYTQNGIYASAIRALEQETGKKEGGEELVLARLQMKYRGPIAVTL